MTSSSQTSVLFLCSANAARSQMAEAFLKHMAGDKFQVYSAGLHPTEIHPLTVQVMNEMGIDMNGQKSKSVAVFLGKQSFDYVISVCDHTAKDCPRLFPGALRILNWPFADPSAEVGSSEEQINSFRKIRDLIKSKIEAFVSENDWI